VNNSCLTALEEQDRNFGVNLGYVCMLAFMSVLITPCVHRVIAISRSSFATSFLFVWMKCISVTASRTELKQRRISKHDCRYDCKVCYLALRIVRVIRNRNFIGRLADWSVDWVVGLLIDCLFGWLIGRFGSKIFKWNFLRDYDNACYLVREISDFLPYTTKFSLCAHFLALPEIHPLA
jgi:hypothetical protein